MFSSDDDDALPRVDPCLYYAGLLTSISSTRTTVADVVHVGVAIAALNESGVKALTSALGAAPSHRMLPLLYITDVTVKCLAAAPLGSLGNVAYLSLTTFLADHIQSWVRTLPTGIARLVAHLHAHWCQIGVAGFVPTPTVPVFGAIAAGARFGRPARASVALALVPQSPYYVVRAGAPRCVYCGDTLPLTYDDAAGSWRVSVKDAITLEQQKHNKKFLQVAHPECFLLRTK